MKKKSGFMYLFVVLCLSSSGNWCRVFHGASPSPSHEAYHSPLLHYSPRLAACPDKIEKRYRSLSLPPSISLSLSLLLPISLSLTHTHTHTLTHTHTHTQMVYVSTNLVLGGSWVLGVDESLDDLEAGHRHSSSDSWTRVVLRLTEQLYHWKIEREMERDREGRREEKEGRGERREGRGHNSHAIQGGVRRDQLFCLQQNFHTCFKSLFPAGVFHTQ